MSWTIEDVRDRLIASGRATADEIERHLAGVDTGAPDLAQLPMISAWAAGRRRTRDSGSSSPR